MSVDIELLFDPAFVGGEWWLLFVLVVAVYDPCWTRPLSDFRFLFLNYCKWILVVELIGSPYEAPLLRYELIKILLFRRLVRVPASESWHPDIERIHCTRHTIDKRRLVLVCEAIHFVAADLVGIPLVDQLVVALNGTQACLVSHPLFQIGGVNSPVVDSLLVLKCFDSGPILLSLLGCSLVVSTLLSLVVRSHLRCQEAGLNLGCWS